MKILALFVASVLLLAACSPAPTPSPPTVPTPTATQVPLSAIDLEPVLIAPGDLPAGYSGAQVRSTPPDMFDSITGYEQAIYQQFADGGLAGGVTVLLFAQDGDRDAAYSAIVDEFGESHSGSDLSVTAGELPDIGERSKYVSAKAPALGLVFTDLAFLDCRAVVHIRLSGITDLDAVTAYAQRLDKRLSALVCP